MVRILGVCGSPRKGATHFALNTALAEAAKIEKTETVLLELRGKKIAPCIGCNKCVNANVNDCLIYHDDMNQIYKDFFDYHGVLIATPVYEMGITGQLAAFFSRFRPFYLQQKDDPDGMLLKFGAAMAVGGTRNGGQEMTIQVIHGFFHTSGMTVINGGLGTYGGAAVWSQDKMAKGAEEDLKGMENARSIGRRLAKAAAAVKTIRDA
jgi:multimeric flavodoxin WrbA